MCSKQNAASSQFDFGSKYDVYLPLDLMAAVGAHHVDDEPQLLTREVDVLLLERPLLGLVRPHEALADVHQSVERRAHHDHLPARRLANLASTSSMYMLLHITTHIL